MCNVAQIMTAVLLVNAMIGASDAFFFAKMFGPSRELEAACPGTCQVRFKQKKSICDPLYEVYSNFGCSEY